MSEQQPQPVSVTHFIARQVVAHKGVPNELDLANSIQEIELETQIDGASFIKVHVIDPEWVLQTSGFVDVNSEGLLAQVEVEFPEGTGWWWRLCAVEGTTDVTQANLILTFEDRIVAYLRDHWGEKTVPPGTTTRAQFIKALVDEVGISGKVKPIKFVCPELNVIQPLELPAKKATTALEKKNLEGAANKSRGLHVAAGVKIKGQTPNAQQHADLNIALGEANALTAGSTATLALLVAGIGESTFDRYAVNGTHQGIWQSDTIPGDQVAKQANAFLTGGSSFQGGGAIKLAHTVSDPGQIATTVEAGGEPASFYNAYLAEAKNILLAGGGAAGTTETDRFGAVSQLTRGTPDNPSEDSWECIERLKQEVDWFAFTNGDTFFYMDGPDLIGQKPVLILEVPPNRVFREGASGAKIVETAIILTGLTYNFDNTAFLYSVTRKLKGKLQRKSRIAKPSTPSEVRLELVCEPTAYRAGDVFEFRNSGPMDGRWIVTDATRNYLKDLFTQFILEPPKAPIAEKLEGSATGGSGPGTGKLGVVTAARKALAEKGKYSYPAEGADRENNGMLYGPAPRTMDCSAFFTLCYKAAGEPDPSGLDYKPIGTTDTLIKHMKKTSEPSPGDACFFGSSASAPTHVSVYVGGGNAISMGKQGDPEEGPAKTTGPAGFLGYWTTG